jgi:hypothetical protein
MIPESGAITKPDARGGRLRSQSPQAVKNGGAGIRPQRDVHEWARPTRSSKATLPPDCTIRRDRLHHSSRATLQRSCGTLREDVRAWLRRSPGLCVSQALRHSGTRHRQVRDRATSFQRSADGTGAGAVGCRARASLRPTRHACSSFRVRTTTFKAGWSLMPIYLLLRASCSACLRDRSAFSQASCSSCDGTGP